MTEQTKAITSEPTYVSVARAMHELGGCSRGYVYDLIGRGLLRSRNPGGRRRLIELASIRKLLTTRGRSSK